MRKRYLVSWLFVLALMGMTACGSSTASPGATATATQPATATFTPIGTATSLPAACATRPTATADATLRASRLAGHVGASAFNLPLSYPLGGPGVASFGQLRWSPDGHYLAMMGQVPGRFGATGYPYLLDTSTNTLRRVDIPGIFHPNQRTLSWENSHALMIIDNVHQRVERFDVNTSTLTELAGITTAVEGMVRCGILFYGENRDFSAVSDGQLRGQFYLHRYDLATATELGTAYTIGQTRSRGPEGAYELPAWDVTPDGTFIAFQNTAIADTLDSGGSLSVSSSFFAAPAADRTRAHILGRGYTSTVFEELTISPNGQQVLFTIEDGRPKLIVTFAISGDESTNRQYRAPADQPVISSVAWLGDSTGFDAIFTSLPATSYTQYRFLLATPIDDAGNIVRATIASGDLVTMAYISPGV